MTHYTWKGALRNLNSSSIGSMPLNANLLNLIFCGDNENNVNKPKF